MTTTSSWLSPSEAGRRLGLSVAQVRNLADQGKLKCDKTPIGRLIDADDVERLKKERDGR